MTNFVDGETLLAADLNAAFAAVTPPASDLLGGTGSAFVPIVVGPGLVLAGSTLTATGGSISFGNGLVESSDTVSVRAGIGLGFSGSTLVADWREGVVTSFNSGVTVDAGILKVEWSAGTVVAVGTGLSASGGTLVATGGAGSVTSIVVGAGLTGGTITTTGTITVDYAATGTPTLRTQPDRAGQDYINVKDYGAVLDGTTNDAPAFNQAYTLAPADASIWVPRGAVHRATSLPSRSGNVLWRIDGDTLDTTGNTLLALGDGDVTETVSGGVKTFSKILVSSGASTIIRATLTNNSSASSGQSVVLSLVSVLGASAAGGNTNLTASAIRQAATASALEPFLSQITDETGQSPASGQSDRGYEAHLIANGQEASSTGHSPGTGARSLVYLHLDELGSTTPWLPTTPYISGQIVSQLETPFETFVCTVPGTSGSTEPTWNTSGPTTDGGVTWVPSGTAVTTGWRATHPFVAGNPTQPVPPNGFTYVCTVGGTTGATQPSWPVSAGTVTDGTVTWAFSGTVAMQAATAINISSRSTAEFAAAILATGPFYDAILEFSGASLSDGGTLDAAIRLAANMPIDFSGDLTAAHQNVRTLRYNSSDTALEYITGTHTAISIADTGITDFPLTPTVLGVPLGGGSVTKIVAGAGLAGGTITASGTISIGTIVATSLFGNAGTVSAVPGAVAVGSGLSLSAAGTLTATGSGGSVTKVSTATPIAGGDITTAGTISLNSGAGLHVTSGTLIADWSGGTVTSVGSGLAITSGTIAATGTAGVSSIVAGTGLSGGTITSAGTVALATRTASTLMGNPGTAAATPTDVTIGTGLSLSTAGTLTATGGSGSVTSVVSGAGLHAGTITSTGTLLADWNGGTVTALGTNLSLSGGTLSASAGSGLTENIQTASYTIQASDIGKLVIFNSTSAVTATYPALATIGVNNVVDISNINTGVVTVTVGAANGTIDAGGTSYFLGQSQFSRQTNNGTNWATEKGLGATTTGAGGAVAFGPSHTLASTGVGFTAGTNNNVNNGAIVFGITNTATTGANSVVIGASNVGAAQQIVLIGNSNTLSGTNNLMIANSSSNSASNPFPSLGLNLLISGNGGGVVAGNSITATGTLSFPYGYQANDHGNALGHYRGQGGPAASSTTPTQREEYTFWNINHGTVAVNLSNNGASPSATVVGNPGTKTAGFVRARVMVVDRANGNANSYYTSAPGVFSKGTTSASMTVNATLTAGGTLGSGLVLVAAPTLAADTTNGGFSVGYTPPLANADTLWAVAWLETDVTPGAA